MVSCDFSQENAVAGREKLHGSALIRPGCSPTQQPGLFCAEANCIPHTTISEIVYSNLAAKEIAFMSNPPANSSFVGDDAQSSKSKEPALAEIR